jgi:hypothetical protein
MRSMLILLTIVTGALAAMPQDVSARDIYVNNVMGDDRATGRYPAIYGRGEGPLLTLGRALAIASKGNRVILADTGEPYRESVTLQAGRNSGFPEEPFVIEGNGAVLDGSAPVPPEAWMHFRGELFRFQPDRFSHQQLFLDGLPVRRRFLGSEGQLPALEPLEWCFAGRHIYFRPEPDQIPDSYFLHHSALPVGLGLYEVRHVVIRDLIVQGFQLDGVNAHDSAFDVSLIGLTCRGNGRSGISVGGSCRVLIQNCLVGDNGAAQVRTEGYSRTRIVDSDLVEGPLPTVSREGGILTIEDSQPTGSLPQ